METIKTRFEEAFGAVFSFPANVQHAEGHFRNNSGVPVVYESRYDTHTILAFIAQELTLLADKISAMSELTAPDRDRVEDFIRAHVKDLEE